MSSTIAKDQEARSAAHGPFTSHSWPFSWEGHDLETGLTLALVAHLPTDRQGAQGGRQWPNEGLLSHLRTCPEMS